MIDKSLIIKRLSLIKYLYQQGIEQSRKPESIAGFSILNFHDGIEMFLRLMVENKGKKESKDFMSHWVDYPDLTIAESIRRLNQIRVNFKHKGILPSKSDVESCVIYTRDFLYDNTQKQFGVTFESVSLIELINYEIVKKHLLDATSKLDSKQYADSLKSCAIAFKSLMDTFLSTKGLYHSHSFMPIDKRIDLLADVNEYDNNFSAERYSKEQERIGEDFRYLAKNINIALNEIKYQFKIMVIGVDYIKYSKFNMLVPEIVIEDGEYPGLYRFKEVEMNEEQCQFCIDFVIESAILSQAIDQDLSKVQLPYDTRKNRG